MSEMNFNQYNPSPDDLEEAADLTSKFTRILEENPRERMAVIASLLWLLCNTLTSEEEVVGIGQYMFRCYRFVKEKEEEGTQGKDKQ